jgi:hypothetical protein
VFIALVALPFGAFLVGRTFLLAGTVLTVRGQYAGSFTHWLWIMVTGNEGRPPQLTLFWLMFLAAVCALIRRTLVGPILFAAFFFALAAASRTSKIGVVHSISGVWYDDFQRIAAFATVISPILVATQAAWLADKLLTRAEARAAALASPRIVAAVTRQRVLAGTGVVAVVLSLFAARPQLGGNARWVGSFYRPPAITAGDLNAFAWLKQHAPGQRVMNPGVYGVSGWMYAIDGDVPAVIQTTQAQRVPGRAALLLCMNEIDVDPTIRPLVTKLGIHYVYTTKTITTADPTDPTDVAAAFVPGLTGLDRLAAFKLVYSSGNAQVYQVLAPSGTPKLPAKCDAPRTRW